MNTNKQTAVIKGDKHPHTSRRATAIVGIMFIFATVSAMLAAFFYPPKAAVLQWDGELSILNVGKQH